MFSFLFCFVCSCLSLSPSLSLSLSFSLTLTLSLYIYIYISGGERGTVAQIGLSPVPWAAFSLGTLTGCLPAVAAYVTSGELGASIAVDGGDTNPWLLAVGIAATISAISVAGNIASDALREEGLDFDLEGESKARS